LKTRRLSYLLRRTLESPLDFLAHKAWIRVCESLLFRPRSPLTSVAESLYIRKLDSSPLSSQPLRLDPAAFTKTQRLQLQKLARVAQEGQFNCLGYGLVDISSPESFHTDCVHHHSWPRDWFPDIDFVCSETRADVKIAWEKSRLQWLLQLTVFAVVERPDDVNTDTITERFLMWQHANPFLFGVNWCSAMEVAVRAINLVTIYRLLLPDLNPTQRSAFHKSLAQHRLYLRLFPEVSDVPGNHYLATQTGALVLDSLMEGDDVFLQQYAGYTKLARAQFNDDGMHIEHAPVYHRLCTDMVLTAYLFAKDRHLPEATSPHQTLEPLLQASTRAMRVVSSEQGLIPVFGDNDSGQIFDFGQNARDAGLYVTTHGSTALLSQFLRAIFPDFSNIQALFGTSPVPSPQASAYPFYTLQTGTLKIVIRAGSLGLSGRGAHDHDDNLSFWLFDQDDDVIVETGCSPYTRSISEREACIRSSSHNVLTPLGEERYGLAEGSVFKTVRGAPTAVVVSQSPESVKAVYTGSFTHERTFHAHHGVIDIRDTLKDATGRFTLNLFLNRTHSTASPVVAPARDTLNFPARNRRNYTIDFSGIQPTTLQHNKACFYPNYAEVQSIEHLSAELDSSISSAMRIRRA
jgi:hypothetical protein